MALRSEWDPGKAASNLAKHGVSFEKAATVFTDSLGRIVDDPRHSADEPRHVLLGHSERQRLLAVMLAERAEAIRPIGAREATRRERREYEEGEGEAGGIVVSPDPDVAAVFPTPGKANEALRALAGIIRNRRRGRARARRSA